MKTRTKALLLSLCAVLLVTVSVLGTVAYLTSTTTVVNNTFTAGNVTITLDEAKVTEYGVADGTTRVTTNTYKLIPDHTYTKDPTVHVASDSEDCWLFVKVENGISAIEGDKTIAAQMTENGWTLVDDETKVYAYNTSVSAGTDVKVFETFTIKSDAKVAQYVTEVDDAGNPTEDAVLIKVTAYAIQKDGFDSAAAAWTAEPAWE